MAQKPSYLGLLNAIAQGEARAHTYLNAWIEKTSNKQVAHTLQTVALREIEHAHAFEKRLWELGYAVQTKPDPQFEKSMNIVTSERSDAEKLEALGLVNQDPEKPDVFSAMFHDKTIDIQTGALLGRYIAEERDTGRLFQACYDTLTKNKDASS